MESNFWTSIGSTGCSYWNLYSIRSGIYRRLNLDNPETKHLLDAYYDGQESKPPITKELKKEVLASLDKFRRNIEKQDDAIIKQIAESKKEIKPFINKSDSSMITWKKDNQIKCLRSSKWINRFFFLISNKRGVDEKRFASRQSRL